MTSPSWHTLLPDLVPRAQTADAVMLNAVAENIDDLQIPGVVVGFKLDEPDRAEEQLNNVAGMMALDNKQYGRIIALLFLSNMLLWLFESTPFFHKPLPDCSRFQLKRD